MPRSKVLRGSALGVAMVVAVVLGTAVGSTRDEWGCASERLGHSIYSLAEGGGYPSPDDAVLGLLPQLAEDGARDRDEYAAALTSRTGPSRYEPETGKLYIDDQVQAQLVLTQLADGTWATENMTLCMRAPSSDAASPFPTPGA